MDFTLLRKYNVPGPRYTSYPTVPYWDRTPSEREWKKLVTETFIKESEKGISLYVHLPYCESLCTYCGCNKIITNNHSLEKPYIDSVLKEWKLYVKQLPGRVKIQELHLGGGTPTFFSPENLSVLIEGILKSADLTADYEMSVEIHPNNTTREHIQTFSELGFNRISIGIQDFDPEVQRVINRVQTVETVEQVTSWIREFDLGSINFDLIYGLPMQTVESIQMTFEEVAKLRPDRIAYYSYAHVPWMKRAQRLFTDDDIPEGEEKRKLYEAGLTILKSLGYFDIGMDHFALETDSLYKAFVGKGLHRNFMGYTTSQSKLLIGLGASSISDSWTGFVQNEKNIRKYQERVAQGELPITRGHVLNEEDMIIRKHILNLMCRYETFFEGSSLERRSLNGISDQLGELEKDGLLGVFQKGIMVSDKGKAFVRNICMAFDQRMMRSKPETSLFSSTV